MKNDNVIVGLVAGLAIGVVLGILFAPAKGSETRQKITDLADEYADILKGKFDEFIDDLAERTSNGQGEAADSPEQQNQ